MDYRELENFVDEAITRIGPGDVDVVYVNEPSSVIIDEPITIRIGVNDDEYSILKVIALAKAHNDPLLTSMWAINEELANRKYSRLGSLALLSRVVDYVLVSSGYGDIVLRFFNATEFRDAVINGSNDLKLRAIYVLGLDAPFSVEMAKMPSPYGEVVRGISGDFISRYSELRSYLLNNTSLEYLLNYLDLVFK